ncbi:hypothetical protein KAR91_12640 [Candidatus Pacearchaeota archaeon]|nr:hypothetical protein [Candidatus Pacearchaeota archaeon]
MAYIPDRLTIKLHLPGASWLYKLFHKKIVHTYPRMKLTDLVRQSHYVECFSNLTEALNQTNPLLDNAEWVPENLPEECNLFSGHIIRTKLPGSKENE